MLELNTAPNGVRPLLGYRYSGMLSYTLNPA
jgi:hypothetical protein